jgi:hypothetical protein
LGPGERWIFGRGIELRPHSVRDPIFAGEWADHIANHQPETVARHFTVIETSDAQVAVVYLDGRLARVIAPSNRVLYWKGAVNVTFETIEVRAEPECPPVCWRGWCDWAANPARPSPPSTRASADCCTSTGV